MERSFYEKECVNEHWCVKELQRQMKSMLFHRIALSLDKNEVLKLAQEGQIIEKPEDILKEPYVFEFTGLPDLPVYKEGDLKQGEVQHEDIGQMNFYLNYYREEMNTEGDTEPIGIVLGAYEDDYSGSPAHPGRSLAQPDRASAHLMRSAVQPMLTAN